MTAITIREPSEAAYAAAGRIGARILTNLAMRNANAALQAETPDFKAAA